MTTFKPATLDELLMFDRRLIAAVRCESVQWADQGTRSERVILETAVVAQGTGRILGPCLLTRYTQQDPVMKPGEVYLVAAYDDGTWTPAWSLVEALPITTGEAAERARQAAESLQARARAGR